MTQITGIITQKRVAGSITQKRVAGSITQKEVSGIIVQDLSWWQTYWNTRYADDLTVEVISDSRIDLSWANNGVADFDSIKVERSLDSYTWSVIATLELGSSTYTDNDVTAYSTIYYYRVRYAKGSSRSASRIKSLFWDEMIVENDFSTGVRWIDQSANNWSVADGVAVFSAATALNKGLWRDRVRVIAGRTYRITFEVSAGVKPRFKIGNSADTSLFEGALNDYAFYSPGTYIFDALCILSSDTLCITGDNTKGTFSLTSFSCKEKTYPIAYTVLPSHTGCSILGSVLYGINGQYLEKSLNFGTTWTRIDHEFIGTVTGCFVSKDGILFVNVGDQGAGGTELWRSTDNGLTWTKVLDTNYGYITVPWNFAQSPNGTIFIGEYTQSYNSAVLWKSVDNGETWTRNDYFFDLVYRHIHQVFVDPETDRLYVTVGDTDKDTYYSDDEGDTWTKTFDAIENGFVSITSVSGARYFGPDIGGNTFIYKSVDDINLIELYKPQEKYNTFWFEVASIEGTSILYAIFINSSDTDHSSGIAKSLDGGATWEIIMLKLNSVLNFARPASDYKHRIPAEFGYLITPSSALGLIKIANELPESTIRPSRITLTLISGGVKIDWTDNSDGLAQTEIWGKSDDGAYALLYTINAGTVTKNDILAPVDVRYYKLRAKNGSVYSNFTIPQSIAMLSQELNSDPNFANTNLWTKAANWSVTDGIATHTAGTTNNITLTSPGSNANIVGAIYRIHVIILTGTAITVYGTDTAGGYAINKTVGDQTFNVTCANVAETYGFRTTAAATISLFSIKRILTP